MRTRDWERTTGFGRGAEYEEEKGGDGDNDNDEGFVAIIDTGVQRLQHRGEEAEGQREDGGETDRCEVMCGERQVGCVVPGESKGSAPAFPVADHGIAIIRSTESLAWR